MILYTCQGFDIRSFSGPLDASKSSYASDPLVGHRLAELRRMIGRDYLWCSASRDRRDWRKRYQFEFQLTADAKDVLCALEGWLWHYMIGGLDAGVIPTHAHVELFGEYGADDPRRRQQWIRENVPPNPIDYVRHHFDEEVELTDWDDVLIQWPLPPDVRVELIRELDPQSTE